jgi:hypothetical protein
MLGWYPTGLRHSPQIVRCAKQSVCNCTASVVHTYGDLVSGWACELTKNNDGVRLPLAIQYVQS